MNKLVATLIVSAGLTAGAPLAFAQTATTPGNDAPQARTGPRAEGVHRHDGQRARLSAAERVEARLAYIRTALKITDAQQSQWNAFADVLRNNARQWDEFHKTARARSGEAKQARSVTAIERLERRQKLMTVASERLNQVVAAAKPLYAALSPEQQKVADAMLARQGHGRKGHHGGMRRGA